MSDAAPSDMREGESFPASPHGESGRSSRIEITTNVKLGGNLSAPTQKAVTREIFVNSVQVRAINGF
jgi:hypothetical protein